MNLLQLAEITRHKDHPRHIVDDPKKEVDESIIKERWHVSGVLR